tara:strand:- start:67 stop:345 length:279 start_codon:yes stop_codon:yes gene_type:complete
MKYTILIITLKKIIGRLMNIEHNPKINSPGMLRFHGSKLKFVILLNVKKPKINKRKPIIMEIVATPEVKDFAAFCIGDILGSIFIINPIVQN